MQGHIINIHPSELLSTKTKKFKINVSLKKKKVFHNNFKKKKKHGQFTIISLKKKFKELTKYKNDYQQYLNYLYRNYIMHLIVYL